MSISSDLVKVRRARALRISVASSGVKRTACCEELEGRRYFADTTAPSAILLTPPTFDQFTQEYTIVVRYTDDVAIRQSTIDSGDVLITTQSFFGPQTTNATLVSTNPAVGNASQIDATYTYFPPVSFFSQNPTYLLSTGLGQVLDTSLNPVPVTSLGTFTVNGNDSTSPVAAIAQQPILDPVSGTYTFTVTYNDDTAVDATTIDSNDVLVFGPQYAQLATKVSQFSNTDLGRVATYTFPAPTTAGTFTLQLQGNQVSDIASPANFASSVTLFQMKVAATTVNGSVFYDRNGNGVQERRDHNIPAQTVYVDINNNGALDTGEPFGTTDARGAYSLSGLISGTYKVRLVQQAGLTQTLPSKRPYYIISVKSGGVFNRIAFGVTDDSVAAAAVKRATPFAVTASNSLFKKKESLFD